MPSWAIVAGVVVALIGAREVVEPAPPAVAEQPVAAASCVGSGGGAAGFGADQVSNAAEIVAVGREMGVPERGWVVALATAMQESTLRNIDYGDRDSLGVFQQRPSQGWGTPAQVTDLRYASRKFYDVLLRVPGWEQMPVTVAAQTVQRSGFPRAYAKWEDEAAAVVAAIAVTCTTT